jgi:hypothetical protein
MSIEKIKAELKRVSSSILESDAENLFRLPSKASENVKQIYKAFGIKRISRPERIRSSEKCSGFQKIQPPNFQGVMDAK